MLLRSANLAILALVFAFPALPGAAETLPSGTEMIVRLENRVAPKGKSGEQFSALLSFPVFVDGREVLPVGSRVEGEVRGAKRRILLLPRRLILPGGRQADFNAAVREIDRRRLRAEQGEGAIQENGSRADAARQSAEVGLAGAQIGAMSTGTAQGLGIGAAAGVAAVLIGRKIASRHHSTVIPAGTQLTLSLSRPLDLPDRLAEAAVPESRPGEPDERRPILRRAN